MMSTVLQLRFPGRRYHATPWDHHVNEGVIEWPPSPWRILRALLSTGFTKLGWPAEGPPAAARTLIARLASVLPTFRLPEAGTGHSRHYVDAAGKKPLILDAWAQVDEGALYVIWPTELDEPERALLAELATQLGYLGRAESWVTARLDSLSASAADCTPDDGGPPGPRFEPIRVLCPMPQDAYASWRQQRVATIEARLLDPGGKKLSKANQKKLDQELAPYPADLIAALCADTGVLKSQGWSAPPGTREVTYWRPTGALAISVAEPRRTTEPATASLALCALSTPSRALGSLPPATRVFPQGRLLHRALGSIIGKQLGRDPNLALRLLGKDDAGKATHDHIHAHLIHLDLDGDGHLDHVLIHVPMGLDASALDALSRLRKTYMKGGAGELQVALAGVGDAKTLRAVGGDAAERIGAVLGPHGGASLWHSATPYVAPRLLKRSGKNSLVGLITDECAMRGHPKPIEIAVLDREEASRRAFRHYVLHDGQREPPMRIAHAISIRFERPFPGPLCLGYGAHAGLGLFAAVA